MILFKELVTQKPVGLKKPDFYKADSDSKKQLERLQQLYATAPDRVKPQIERDMKLLAYGIAGEESVAFELNNSYLPIVVLHDLRLEHEGSVGADRLPHHHHEVLPRRRMQKPLRQPRSEQPWRVYPRAGL